MENKIYDLMVKLGADPSSESAKRADEAFCAVFADAAQKKIATLDLKRFKVVGNLAKVASSHGTGLPNLVLFGLTPDSQVYMLSGGMNGKRPDYLVVEGATRIQAKGYFFGRESGFSLIKNPDPNILNPEEKIRVEYAAIQAATQAAQQVEHTGVIINMTPHPVNIVDQDGKIVKIFESAGQIRLASQTVPDIEIDGIPTSKTVFGEAVGLPEYTGGTFYIVSQLVKSALPGRTDLLVPAEVVRDASGNIIGCRSLGR
jgi:hypothetical protein